MMAAIVFSMVVAGLVYLAGRKDAARDPRLTGVALALLVVFPLVTWFLPKIALLPPPETPVGSGDSFSGSSWIFGIWVVGFGLSGARLILVALRVAVWSRRSSWIANEGRIEIRLAEGLKGPVAAGVLRPVILVPLAWSGWSERVRRIVVEHETAHHRHRDPLWRWVAEIATAVYWFNPLVGWMARRLAVQCEYACDNRVLQSDVGACEYAGLLCDLAEDFDSHSPAMAMAERASLEGRVRRLMGSRSPSGMVGVPVMISLALCAASALSLLGFKPSKVAGFSPGEVELRWAADPFPAESDGGGR